MMRKKGNKERFKAIQKSYFDDAIFKGKPSEFFEKGIEILERNKVIEKKGKK